MSLNLNSQGTGWLWLRIHRSRGRTLRQVLCKLRERGWRISNRSIFPVLQVEFCQSLHQSSARQFSSAERNLRSLFYLNAE